MVDLTNDELTVLTLCAQGESIAAIGRWEKPCESLVAKGYLRANDKFNHAVTPAGKAAQKEAEDAPFKAMIESSSRIGATQAQIRDFAEQAAQLLAQAARASSAITRDSAEHAAREWSKVILDRTLELLR